MDRDIAERMRIENIEQFQTLVRMHLSFELDLNTDTAENDVVKSKTKKRFNFPKKSKTVASSKVSNTPFDILQTLSLHSIQQIRNIIAFLMRDQNIIQEGIFRRTGSLARQNDLRRRFNENTDLNLEEGVYSVHDCASVLKGILSDLPEPLLTDTFYAVHCQIAELCNSVEGSKGTRLLHSIQLLLLLLPAENRSLLHDVINMLNETTKHESSNKMSAESLATLFSPHLICPRKLSPEALHTASQNMSGVISFMITKGSELQDIPTKLATDIRAYFVDQRRKRVMSPEMQLLDVSVTSDSVANTVYTFCDREKTAEAHVSNPTDTALAQLYAYIQTLPESSKKRKLVKQFNKENGQGTPLQTQMLLRLKKNEGSRSKSLSGSIKKHIFQNTLGSKTPKRSSISSGGSSTPTFPKSIEQVSKPRIVFQTPQTIHEPREQLPKNDTFQTPSIIVTEPDHTPQPDTASQGNGMSATASAISDDGDHNDEDDKENEQDEVAALNEKTAMPFNKAAIKIFHKSEPNLSNVLGEKNSTPIINRGKHIAKKLFSSVSMINLRRPFAHCHAVQDTLGSQKLDDAAPETPRTSLARVSEVASAASRSVGAPKLQYIESSSPIMNESSANETMADSIGRESVSPITKSTHRMSKAMQESIMTPRSRKPVIIGAMLSMNTDNYRKNFLSLPEDDDELLGKSKDQILNSSLYKSKSEGDLMGIQSPFEACNSATSDRNEVSHFQKRKSDETLSTPFRKYLFSRSLLTTTPVDSSFSSQSDDFENLNDSEMSESLIYCLNGNEPQCLSPRSTDELNTTYGDINACRKRRADISGCANDNLFCDYSNGKAKKNHIELDETAL